MATQSEFIKKVKSLENKPNPNKSIKVYELDFGDTNFISASYKDLLDWIETDISDIKTTGKLYYEITVKYMKKKDYDNLPEWA